MPERTALATLDALAELNLKLSLRSVVMSVRPDMGRPGCLRYIAIALDDPGVYLCFARTLDDAITSLTQQGYL